MDTFIIRAWLVPALMLMAVDWNWWPGKFKVNHKDVPADMQWLQNLLDEKDEKDGIKKKKKVKAKVRPNASVYGREVELQERPSPVNGYAVGRSVAITDVTDSDQDSDDLELDIGFNTPKVLYVQYPFQCL